MACPHARAQAAVVILIARITPGCPIHSAVSAFQWLGLLGTLWPQIIIHLVVTVPIVIWIMIGYSRPRRWSSRVGVDRRRQPLADLPLRRAADRKAGIAVAFISPYLLLDNFVFGIVLAGRETRPCPSRSTT